MQRWITRGLFLAGAIALSLGFHYFAAKPNPAMAFKPRPTIVYVDPTIH